MFKNTTALRTAIFFALVNTTGAAYMKTIVRRTILSPSQMSDTQVGRSAAPLNFLAEEVHHAPAAPLATQLTFPLRLALPAPQPAAADAETLAPPWPPLPPDKLPPPPWPEPTETAEVAPIPRPHLRDDWVLPEPYAPLGLFDCAWTEPQRPGLRVRMLNPFEFQVKRESYADTRDKDVDDMLAEDRPPFYYSSSDGPFKELLRSKIEEHLTKEARQEDADKEAEDARCKIEARLKEEARKEDKQISAQKRHLRRLGIGRGGRNRRRVADPPAAPD